MGGPTRAQRRRHRRRRRSSTPPSDGRAGEPRRSDDERAFRRALAGSPRWVKAVWATPARRLALSAGGCAVGAWILVYGITDPAGAFAQRRFLPGFVAAPLLLALFGAQGVQAALDLARGRTSVPVFHRAGRWLDRHLVPFAVIYLGAMAVVLWRVLA